MILPSLTLVYDRKKVATTTKEASVELRVTYGRKSKYMSTGVRLLPKHWRGHYVTNRADAADLNDALDLIVQNVRKIINDMVDDGCLNIDEIPSRLSNMTADKKSFVEFCAERSTVRMYGKKGDTKERYARFMRWLRQWGKIVYFSDVTDKNIIKMDEELAKTSKRKNRLAHTSRFFVCRNQQSTISHHFFVQARMKR